MVLSRSDSPVSTGSYKSPRSPKPGFSIKQYQKFDRVDPLAATVYLNLHCSAGNTFALLERARKLFELGDHISGIQDSLAECHRRNKHAYLAHAEMLQRTSPNGKPDVKTSARCIYWATRAFLERVRGSGLFLETHFGLEPNMADFKLDPALMLKNTVNPLFRNRCAYWATLASERNVRIGDGILLLGHGVSSPWILENPQTVEYFKTNDFVKQAAVFNLYFI